VRQLGFYYLAARLPSQIFQVWRTLSVVIAAAFSRADRGQLSRGLDLTTRFSAFLVGLPLAVVIPLAQAARHNCVRLQMGAGRGALRPFFLAAMQCASSSTTRSRR